MLELVRGRVSLIQGQVGVLIIDLIAQQQTHSRDQVGSRLH